MVLGNNLAIGVTLVFGFGSAALGTVGTVAELAVKEINQDKHPLLRAISLVFAKTLQSGPAAFSLLLIGSLYNPWVYMAAFIGTCMLLTPLLNGIVQHSSFGSLKKGMDIADRTVSISAKILNTALMAVGAAMALGPFAAVLTGSTIGALNYAAYHKA